MRGENVRLASGFGMRFHPILRYVRPHNGIDWAAPTGTPILAAGNGVVEEAKYKGEYGNYVRIQHANGYQSTYAHMSRYAPRMQEGARVRQGEVIGYVGNTGLVGGPAPAFRDPRQPAPPSIRCRSRCRASASSPANCWPSSRRSGRASTS